jgi:putative ABC transport system permease protein
MEPDGRGDDGGAAHSGDLNMLRSKLRSIWNGLSRRSDVEKEMAEELSFHIEARADHLMERGMPRDEALRQARLEFGSADKYREEMRQARGLRFLDELRGDLRYAFRGLRKTPTFSLAAILTLALGIGANSLVFSVVRSVVLRPLDYAKPDELVQLWESGNIAEGDWVSFPNYRDIARQAQSFANIAAYTFNGTTLSGDKEAETVLTLETTDKFFDLLSVKPALGRTFAAGEDQPGRDRVAVISHALWQRRYAGDTNVAGHQLLIGGRPHTIIGVMPPSFRFPNVADMIDVWVAGSRRTDIEGRGNHNFWAIARLKPGIGLSQTRAEMVAVASSMEREFPQYNKGLVITVEYLQDRVSGDVRPALLMLLGSVVLLLLLACANIANLLLSRAESRRREMAIREAIGAGRGRLIRQMLTESILLAFLGGAAGLIVVKAILQSLLKWAPADIPRIQQTSIDLPVLLFTSAIALLAGILFGLAPAVIGAGRNVHDALKRSATRSSPERSSFALRHILIASQVALAVILLIGAGLLMRSLINVTHLDPGFRRDGLFIAIFNLDGQASYTEPAQQAAFFEEVLRRVRTVPGVKSAAVTGSMPLTGINDQGSFAIEGLPSSVLKKYGHSSPEANRPHVSVGYFETMGIQLQKGRTFDEHDRADSPKVAVISDLAARKYWPNENPIGKRVSIAESEDGRRVWHEIVGIVHSTRHFGMEAAQKAEVYVPHTQSPYPFMVLVVRVRGNMDSVIRGCRNEIASLDPQQAGFPALRAEDTLFGSETRRRFQTSLLAGFAILAVFLAAIGIYGVVAYTVRRRAREIGIRIALGARPSDVVLAVVKQGMFTIVAGAIAGVVAAGALSRLLASLLFGVTPSDTSTFSAVVFLVLLVGILSVYLPTRAASRLDPVIVLNEE